MALRLPDIEIHHVRQFLLKRQVQAIKLKDSIPLVSALYTLHLYRCAYPEVQSTTDFVRARLHCMDVTDKYLRSCEQEPEIGPFLDWPAMPDLRNYWLVRLAYTVLHDPTVISNFAHDAQSVFIRYRDGGIFKFEWGLLSAWTAPLNQLLHPNCKPEQI